MARRLTNHSSLHGFEVRLLDFKRSIKDPEALATTTELESAFKVID